MNSTKLWRPLTKESLIDPYPMYGELRRADPVHHAATGEYIVSGYHDVKQVLKNGLFKSGNRLVWLKKGIEYFDTRQEDLRAIYSAMNTFILMLNDAQHQRIRNFVSRTWQDRHVDTIIQNNIDNLLRQPRKKSIDFVTDYAQPLPVYTIADILGIPTADHKHLSELGVAMTKTLDLYISLKDLVQMNRAAADFVAFFHELLKAKTDHPDSGLFSNLINKNKREKFGLTEDELVSIGIFLFTAGEETTAGLISSTMLNLLTFPDQLALLRSKPELAPSVIEESLRYDSPVHLLGRLASEDTTIRNTDIPAGATVTLVVASANRDETAFENPDDFLITRNPNRHLSFGSGPHFCLGDWLGRKQSQLAIHRFLASYPKISLAEQELTRYDNLAVRRLNHLYLEIQS